MILWAMIFRSCLTWLAMFCSPLISLDSHKPCAICATYQYFLGQLNAYQLYRKYLVHGVRQIGRKRHFRQDPSFLFVNTNTCFFMWSATFANCRQRCCIRPVRHYQQTQNKSAATKQVFIKFSISEGNK